MPPVPQIIRERLMGSSQVGTPGVDTSGLKIGEAIGTAGQDIANTGLELAVQQKNLQREGEFASLMLDHSQNIMAAAEHIKQQDAANPERMAGDLSDAMSNSLKLEASKTNDPFLKLMVGRGDPSAQMWALRQISSDAADQQWKNTLTHATNTGNEFINKALTIGGNPNLSPEDMLAQTAPLIHGIGLLHSNIAAGLHGEMADGISDGITKGVMKGLIDSSITGQPWKTNALLQNPEVTRYFSPQELKTYQDDTSNAIKAYPGKQATLQIQNDLQKYPGVINDVLSGKLGYASLDAKQRTDMSPNNTSFYNYLKDISLGVTAPGTNNLADKDSIKGQLVDEANRLGFKLPGQFATSDASKDFLAAKVDPNIKDLFKFRDDLTGALARQIISPEEFSTFNKQLLTPLTAATLKKNDPSAFAQMLQSPHSPFRESDPSKVDDFRGPYNTIERALSLHQMDEKSPEYAAMKANAYDSYFKALDAVKPGQLNALGRPYSHMDVAHAIMGEELGRPIIVKGQVLGNISGYRASDGMPMVDTPKEWQATLANAQNLKDIR